MTDTKYEYDGVIVFGAGDWWVHNRGHYDMQFSKKFSATIPVLYVNSTGMRMPSLFSGDGTFKRITRKFKSLFKGCVKFDSNFFVATPFAVPGKFGYLLTAWIVPLMIKKWSRSIGIRNPLFWVATPMAYQWFNIFQHSPVVYQRTDFYEHFPEVDFHKIKSFDKGMKTKANIILYCSHYILNEAKGTDYEYKCHFIDHGVDFKLFKKAGDASDKIEILTNLSKVSSPIAGFIGALEADVVNSQLITQAAKDNPEITFILVGKSTFNEDVFKLDNIILVGQVDYLEVPKYMAFCDLLLMPWNDNEWIKACNPIKLKEYLAIGKPIVTTYFPELDYYDGLVNIASDKHDFSTLVKNIVNKPVDLNEIKRMRARVESHTWVNKLSHVEQELSLLGFKKLEL
ncbi:glycosyltransferase [Shewanella sp. OMA3-2]|uniref:glycosyltransferase n=1 Tax=Shewanella sp. OMA3-2 TaxID=2908650 RepID=UPI001F30E46D|nr:glycosyltransferase [Shewanella sp. OMA3-2]UJF23371.1 glycosyltransferase [Shewanella sp. OMA3-2]